MGVTTTIGQSHRTKLPGRQQGLVALVRKLVAHAHDVEVQSPPPRHDTSEETAEVLVDCEVDGVRCVVTQARTAESADALSLSPREVEISRMVAKGYPNKAIAAVLDISVWTVSTHLRRVFAKFAVNSRAALVAKMIRQRML